MSDSVVATAWLFGFRIDSAALRSIHCSWLDKHVLPVLAGGGSVGISGMTSRTGSAAHNLALSKRRANAVLAYLRRKVRRHVSYRVNWLDGTGEESAKFLGQKDGTEDPLQRAVVVAAWHRPTPPPPPAAHPPSPAAAAPVGQR